MIEGGLPLPILQSKYQLQDGATGFGKYRREMLKPGTEDALTAEKVREDRLRDLDLGVIRGGGTTW